MRVTLSPVSLAHWQSHALEYLRYEYDLKPADIVLDIGAYKGEWADAIHHRYGCRVVVVEPGPWIVGFQWGKVINKAAATYDGTMRFGGAYYYTSAHEPDTHEYPCFDINDLLNQYDDIAVVKLNVEGTEYDLLDHVIAAGLHRRIRNLQVQFHIIEDGGSAERYEAITKTLAETHRLTYYYPFCWENWQRC